MITLGFKEFQDMGMEGNIWKPWVGPTCLEERWVVIVIGFEGGVSEIAIVKR